MANTANETEIIIEYYEMGGEDPLNSRSTTAVDNNGNHPPALEEQSENNVKKEVREEKQSWYKSIDSMGRYLCRFCDISYGTIQTLRYHTKKKHQDHAVNLKNVISRNIRKKRTKCHVCKENFTDIEDLKNHVSVEHFKGNPNNFCPMCQAVFSDVFQLSEHLQTEHKILPNAKVYICDICGYSTFKVSHYKQHNNTHSDAETTQCKHCDYKTNYLPNLRTHERIHSSKKPYVCNFSGCNYTAVAQSAFRCHQLKHTPEKSMLYCEKCTYKTVYKHSLKKHSDSHERNTLKIDDEEY